MIHIEKKNRGKMLIFEGDIAILIFSISNNVLSDAVANLEILNSHISVEISRREKNFFLKLDSVFWKRWLCHPIRREPRTFAFAIGMSGAKKKKTN